MNHTVQGVYWKANLEPNPITPFVNEYIERMTLRKIGFTSSYDKLPYMKAKIFCMISAKLDDIKEKEMKKARSK